MTTDSDRFYWANYPSPAFAALAAQDPVAVLPVGAIEQHGPHLPVSVDADIVNGFVSAAVARLAKDPLPVLFLPAMPVGKSTEHVDFPGTLTFSATTLMAMWNELGDAVARAGIRRLVFLNSHGGQIAPMDIVTRDLRIRHNMLVVGANWFGLGLPGGLIDDHELKYGIHAGELETAMMLHLHKDKVHMDKAQNFVSAMENINTDNRHLGLTPAGRLGWKAADLNRAGACGNAAKANAATGKAAMDYVADRLIELLREVLAFDLSRLSGADTPS